MRQNTVQAVRQYTIYAVKTSETERKTGCETVKQTGTNNAGIETTYDPENGQGTSQIVRRDRL
jgi:hypothetical protein